jgi:starch synthase
MHIVQIAPEMAPIAKAGGLADVMMGLSRELQWKGNKVTIILPKYDFMTKSGVQLQPIQKFRSYYQGKWHENTLWSCPVNGELTAILLESHHENRFFDRGVIYGQNDDVSRFLYFSRAVIDWLYTWENAPDVIHIHDWETAPVALLAKDDHFRRRFIKTKVVLTVHNFEYQGWCPIHELSYIELEKYQNELHMPKVDYVNLLKGGIIYSDAVTTVSPTYAKEVITPQGGGGLDDLLRKSKQKFFGILNGLDYSFWNPEIDKLLPFRYPSLRIENPSLTLDGKAKNKESLFRDLGMKKKNGAPLLASITRLVPQKGVELLKHGIAFAEQKGMQCILLGTAYDSHIQDEFVALQRKYQNSPDIRIILKTEEQLAHRIYAASDIFMVPSMFEPCGLTQLIALKYGSVPIVRKTGGLSDTIVDAEIDNKPFEKSNGFCFIEPTIQDMDRALERAYTLFCQNQKKWYELVSQGMRADFSWNIPANSYLDVYSK